jgi:hypothetical protein
LGILPNFNLPRLESQQVDGMFADQQMTGSSAIASKLLNDSPAKRFNESSSYKLCNQLLLQVAQKMYYPSNVFDNVSNDVNRNPQVQRLVQGHSTSIHQPTTVPTMCV